MDDLLAEFLTETNEMLAELDLALVRLESKPADRDTLALIFRLVHTIKGTCGFLGLPRLEKVAHAAENVLGRVRDEGLAATPALVTAVLGAADAIRAIVTVLQATGAEPVGDDANAIAALDAVFAGPDVTAPDVVAPDVVAWDVPRPTAAVAAAEVMELTEAATGATTIRVGVEVLETLMTLVSELVLTRNQLLQLARARQDTALSVPLQRLSHITTDLQEGVMKTRMQPVGNAWNKLPRLVRDLARDLGKKIELRMRGAETELDRQVLEMIRDPLTHMVRNSADHGLESPADRRAAGKPETGRITLEAFQQGGHIVIEISDDGRGLPIARIREKALARGLASEDELASMADADVARFIFHAGFSTASEVTSVSGRGVGMDVVKTNIERIGGSVDLRAVPGRGTTFTIKIPLTLAIVSALIVSASGERFAIPQLSVVELVSAASRGGGQASLIERVGPTPVLRLRDRLLPLVSLETLLRLSPSAEPSLDDAAKLRGTIVVAQVGGGTLGIVVDRVFDTEEIVVKPVAPILRHMTMFSGTTILGDGSVIMILDPTGIARATGLGDGAGLDRPADHGGGHGVDPCGDAQAGAMLRGIEKRKGAPVSLLVFRAGGQLMAVPLGLVARLETIDASTVEVSSGAAVVQYRDRLMPLVPLGEGLPPDRAAHSVLVFSDLREDGSGTARDTRRERRMGLVVDEIVDVVHEALSIELRGDRPGLLGTAVIAGRATDVIDASYWVTRAFADWFDAPARGADRAPASPGVRLLVVDDSDFFRQVLVPALAAEGFDVTAVADPVRALRLRDDGHRFDAVISDIDMPGMDGLAFVRELRGGGAWARLPVIALSGRVSARDIEAGRDAGFTDYVAKFDRAELLASLRQCLSEWQASGRLADDELRASRHGGTARHAGEHPSDSRAEEIAA